MNVFILFYDDMYKLIEKVLSTLDVQFYINCHCNTAHMHRSVVRVIKQLMC